MRDKQLNKLLYSILALAVLLYTYIHIFIDPDLMKGVVTIVYDCRPFYPSFTRRVLLILPHMRE